MKTYTIEELQELPDADLNALAAELRGWHVAFGAIDTLAGETVREHHWEGRDNEGELGAIISLLDLSPATDRNQSGKLLEWFVESHYKSNYLTLKWGSGALVRLEWTLKPSMEFQRIEIPGNTARAETIAFCAAMLAIHAQRGASEKA